MDHIAKLGADKQSRTVRGWRSNLSSSFLVLGGMLRSIGIVDTWILLSLPLLFWGCVLWAVIVVVRALRDMGTPLQRIAREMELRNQIEVPTSSH